MKERKIDIKQVCSDLDISYAHVCNILSGKYQPSLKLCIKIRKVYNLPLGEY
tara:strand:+ start:287 stop:442 length:156 start_codon:yes stop_codon:yes gene_type:complete